MEREKRQTKRYTTSTFESATSARSDNQNHFFYFSFESTFDWHLPLCGSITECIIHCDPYIIYCERHTHTHTRLVCVVYAEDKHSKHSINILSNFHISLSSLLLRVFCIINNNENNNADGKAFRF